MTVHELTRRRASMDRDMRRRCDQACRKLSEAIEELDACGLFDAATHAHLCLDLVREALQEAAERKVRNLGRLADR
jgi:hypothetical protein